MTDKKITEFPEPEPEPEPESEVDRLLAESSRDVPLADPALMTRVLEDAYQVMAEREQPAALPEVGRAGRERGERAHKRGFAALVALIGGWPALAGMATAAVAGVWLGYVAPAALTGLDSVGAVAQPGYDFGDFTAAYDDLLGEG